MVVGTFSLTRNHVEPFTERQIEVIRTFADQDVIAIENTRLLNELRQRTTELTERTADLTEALEQQTATSEVLRVISSSPNELDPVFQNILANATRICDANFGLLHLNESGAFPVVATHDVPAAFAEFRSREPLVHPSPKHPLSRVAATKEMFHVPDVRAEGAYVERDASILPFVDLTGARTVLIVPMLKESDLVGTISIFRQEVRPFTDKQIELVKNFAAQAVIAIENTRLLNELRRILAAADRHRRRAQSHQPVDVRPAKCARYVDQVSRPALRGRQGRYLFAGRRLVSVGRKLRVFTRGDTVCD